MSSILAAPQGMSTGEMGRNAAVVRYAKPRGVMWPVTSTQEQAREVDGEKERMEEKEKEPRCVRGRKE